MALMVQIATADLLYFQLGGSSHEVTYSYNGETVNYDFATVAMVYANGEKANNYMLLYSGGQTTSDNIFIASESTSPIYAGLPADYNDGTYKGVLFELWASGDALVGYQNFSLDEMGGHIVGGTNQSGSPLAVTSVVPEPTSGMLVVLGMAGLALRRKTMDLKGKER